jgi:hypothetical protein
MERTFQDTSTARWGAYALEELDGTPLKFKTAACFVKRFYPRGNVEAEDVKQASDEDSVVSEDLVEQQVSGVDDEVDEDGVDDDDEGVEDDDEHEETDESPDVEQDLASSEEAAEDEELTPQRSAQIRVTFLEGPGPDDHR